MHSHRIHSHCGTVPLVEALHSYWGPTTQSYEQLCWSKNWSVITAYEAMLGLWGFKGSLFLWACLRYKCMPKNVHFWSTLNLLFGIYLPDLVQSEKQGIRVRALGQKLWARKIDNVKASGEYLRETLCPTFLYHPGRDPSINFAFPFCSVSQYIWASSLACSSSSFPFVPAQIMVSRDDPPGLIHITLSVARSSLTLKPSFYSDVKNQNWPIRCARKLLKHVSSVKHQLNLSNLCYGIKRLNQRCQFQTLLIQMELTCSTLQAQMTD